MYVKYTDAFYYIKLFRELLKLYYVSKCQNNIQKFYRQNLYRISLII